MSLKRIRKAKTLAELADACIDAASSLEKDINDIIKESALQLTFNLIYATPVDTSTATSNWQVGLMLPAMDARTAYFYGDEGSTAAMSRGAAYAAARAAIAPRKAGTRIYISNLVDYIVELNQGKSPQQPSPNWIEKIEDAARLEINIKLSRLANGY